MGLVAGENINIVDLCGCSLSSAEHMAWIVVLVREKCQGATEVNIEGCSDWPVVRAVAECLAETFWYFLFSYFVSMHQGNGQRRALCFPRAPPRESWTTPGPRSRIQVRS